MRQRRNVISDAGEAIEGQDFTLAAVVVPPSPLPSPDPSVVAGPAGGDSGVSGRLAAPRLGAAGAGAGHL